MSSLLVLPFRHGPFWNFSYLVACSESREAAVIDPAWDVPAMLLAANVNQLEINTVLLTHTHSDHINGLAAMVAATDARVVVHGAELAALPPTAWPRVDVISGDEPFAMGNVPLQLLHTPGHSPGSLAILADGHVFSGDTLHVGGVGRPGPELDSLEALWESLRGKLTLLPDETILHPGHDEGPSATSTLGIERQRVAALTAGSFRDFVRAMERSTGRTLG
jgi:glyoxylase-like metal-dependent hydrolase (beta-lactamase superfamily II)